MTVRIVTTIATVMLFSAGALPAEPVPAKSQAASVPATLRPVSAPASRPATPSSATAPAGPVCVAILEPEVLADMPAEQRKALAGVIDTLLTESLSQQRGIVIVDRQALDKVLADDRKAEDLARGLALINLVNVRHAAKDSPGLEQALDKLVAMFPELGASDPFSCAKTVQWYRNQAGLNSSASKPASPASKPSRPSRARAG